MPKPDGLSPKAQLWEVGLDRVAVDLKGGGGFNNVSIISHEPIESVMPLEILREQASFPKTIKGGKSQPKFFNSGGR